MTCARILVAAVAVLAGATNAPAASALVDGVYVAFASAMAKRLPLVVDAASTITDVRYAKAVGLSRPAAVEYDVIRSDLASASADADALIATFASDLRAHYCRDSNFQPARNDKVGIVLNVHASDGTLAAVAAIGPRDCSVR